LIAMPCHGRTSRNTLCHAEASSLFTPRTGLYRLCVCVALVLAALSGADIACAQTSAEPGAAQAQEALRRQEERSRQQQEALTPHADALTPTAKGARAPKLPDEQPCFVIHDIALTGPDAWRFGWLAASTEPFANRCIGTKGLSAIASYLDAQLIELGYVTSRVSLPGQNLASGRLEFRLDAGRIAQVRMVRAGDPQRIDDDRWGTWVNAFPTAEGRLLNARDLEQGVEQMKRLPSQSVTTLLEPGAKPGTSNLVIAREAGELKDRLRGGITLDNSGSPTLGRTQFSASLSLDNPLGLNDIGSLSLNTNAEQPRPDRRSQSYSASYGIPFGYSTFSLSASHSRFAQIVQLPSLPHLSHGQSDSAEVRWQHIAVRTASAKAGVYASLSQRRASSFLDDTELTTQRRRTTFFETGVSFKRLFEGSASFEMEAGHRRGVPWLSAQDDLPSDPACALSCGSPLTLRPRISTLNASLALPFKAVLPWQYSLSLRAQHTSDHTLSVDQLAIGNRSTVRGFDGDSVLLAENGWTLRNELSTPLQLLEGIESQLYVGLDAGRVWGPSGANLLGHTLVGAALGVRGRCKAVQFDLALAGPISIPEGFMTGRLNVYASATYGF
jgi:hemolysin activation/secretion protein